ncbi:MAG: adenine deaminase, partial [Syntrophales bacterium]|nr:adenine deaminase [Syntrophales bacterium]
MSEGLQEKSRRIETLIRRIKAAKGDIPPDLVLKNGRILNLFSSEIIEADIAVHEGTIVGIGSYDGPHIVDRHGLYVSPGFMDGHIHLESTMLSP